MEVAQLSFKNALKTQESAVSFLSITPKTQKQLLQGLDQFGFKIVQTMVGYLKTLIERNSNSDNVKLYAAAVTEMRSLCTQLYQSGSMPNAGTTTKIPIPVTPEAQLPFVKNEWTTARTRPPITATSPPDTTPAITPRATTTTPPIRAIATTSKPTTSLPPSKPPIRFAGENWYVLNRFIIDKLDDNNAVVDSNGRLHLRLTKRGSSWRCAGIKSVQPFGFGHYEFHVEAQQLSPESSA